MDLVIVIPDGNIRKLGDLNPGDIFCFADSAETPQYLFEALQNFGQNFFLVFKGDGSKKKGEVDIASLDGKQKIRRMSNRSVRPLYSGTKRLPPQVFLEGYINATKKRASNVACGDVVVYGVTFDDFKALDVEKQKKFIYLKVEGNPSPVEKVILVSLHGEEVMIDDDLLVHPYDHARFVLKAQHK